MSTLKRGELWLGLAAVAQIAALFVINYIFTDRVYDALMRLERNLSQGGMSVEQSRAMSEALFSFRLNISFLVTSFGISLIAINFVALGFLLNRMRQE